MKYKNKLTESDIHRIVKNTLKQFIINEAKKIFLNLDDFQEIEDIETTNVEGFGEDITKFSAYDKYGNNVTFINEKGLLNYSFQEAYYRTSDGDIFHYPNFDFDDNEMSDLLDRVIDEINMGAY